MERMKRKSSLAFENGMHCTNARRAFASALVMCVLIPVGMLIAGVFYRTNDITPFLIWGVVSECVQLVMAVVHFVLLRRQRAERYKLIYLSYYAVTLLTIIIAAAMDLKVNGSEILYVASCLYLIFVPILTARIRVYYVIGQSIVMVIMLAAVHMSVRNIADVILVQFCTVFLSGYQHKLTVQMKHITNHLKEKTISSQQDAMTGLLNRRGLELRTESTWSLCARRQVSVAAIMLDIDFFKKYNDKFGHPQGDRCLMEVARILKKTAKRSTDVVTRTGGEEFLIYVQDSSAKDAVSLALKIRKEIERAAIPHAYCAISRYVTVSMGIAVMLPSQYNDFEQLYEEADKALYLAKEHGRNCIVCDHNVYGRIRNGMAQVISM